MAIISPSTGISHIANNLNVPLIWLCSKRDKYLWCGDNMDSNSFVILHKTTQNVSKEYESRIITEVLEKFQNLIESKT